MVIFFFVTTYLVSSISFYDFEVVHERQKYDVGQLRQRVQDFMQKSGKGSRGSAARQVKTLANVGAKAKAFK